MKKTNQSANGTSFHNSVIKTTIAKLREACGEPECECNDGSDKVNIEWVMETDSGDVFTIYDWKEYREIGEDETIRFHVGGTSGVITNQALEELEEAILKAV